MRGPAERWLTCEQGLHRRQRCRAQAGNELGQQVRQLRLRLLKGLVAELRQLTSCLAAHRIGVARAAEQAIKEFKGKKKSDALSPGEKVIASAVGAFRFVVALELVR